LPGNFQGSTERKGFEMIARKAPEEVEEIQIGKLRLLRGGKGPPLNTGGINWLNGLDKGTCFSCKKKGNDDVLEVLIVAFKYDKTVILVNAFHSENRFAVDPEVFCKKFSLHEVIGKEEQELPAKEIEDGSSGTVQSGGIPDNEDAEE
jgi:hypothetical protein